MNDVWEAADIFANSIQKKSELCDLETRFSGGADSQKETKKSSPTIPLI
jgi:hypothetical protein